MNILLHKQTSRDIEKNENIDHLLDLIRCRVSEFQGGNLGKIFSIDGFHFELLVAKRNTVYRIKGPATTWYAKIPSREGAARAQREKLGADVMALVGQQVDSCCPIPNVAVCLKHGVIITEALAGEHIHTQLYRSILALNMRRHHWILDAYRALGTVLAVFHASNDTNTPVTTRITALDEFDEVARLLPDDLDCNRLSELLTANDIDAMELGLIHGNLRRENIILTPDRKVGLIDFEDSGLGSRYDDLSKICSAMLLTKTARVFPWRPVYRALNAMLFGYNQRSPLRETTLLRYITVRVATQFAQSFTNKRQTIARIPVSQRKTHQLLNTLLSAIEQRSLALVDKRLRMKFEIEN